MASYQVGFEKGYYMKKIAVIGRGTVGCLAVAHFSRWTNFEIDWYYDTSIEPVSVGEGTNLAIPRTLGETIGFDGVHMDATYSTPKLGVWKRNWGKGKEYIHTFPGGLIGIHFSAVSLQKHLFEILVKNRKVKTIENNVDNYEEMDYDYVLVCTGSPKTLGEGNFIKRNIPVNSCTVFQCPWDLPKFNYSLTFAKKHGWIFGIPLKNRCAIGYVNNSDYSTEEDINNEVQEVLDEFGLVAQSTRTIKFDNYSRAKNYTEKVCYNGNASYFLEPLEAASTGFSDMINRTAFDILEGNLTVFQANVWYDTTVNEFESMLCLHYFAGSTYDTDFWKYAKKLVSGRIHQDFEEKNAFARIIKQALYRKSQFDQFDREVGPWTLNSFAMNIDGLEIANEMKSLIKLYNV